MANLSVVELLSDPDFVDPCTVLRQVEVIGADGIATYQTQSIPILASLQAATGDELEMTADAARTSGTYEVITTFPLATATDTSAADTVLWRGCEYVVISIGRFGNFAGNAGHYEGLMTLKTISPAAGPP
ncbi:MAG TPA: hypothetical protein VK741_22820 [Acetobacteraceae bacterium]|jgi:hypothetical protein|nr:hypothetical protein [Acetobacteraceae bacterium]